MRDRQKGQALVFTAAALVVLIGFAGMAIDMGVLRHDRRVQQTAADAAAIAGADNLPYSGWQAGAQNAAVSNGFTDASSNDLTQCGPTAAIGTVCVQIDSPPVDGPHANSTTGCSPAPSCYVEARVAVVRPTYFMTIVGIKQETVMARAVATTLRGSPTGGAGCVYTLGAPQNKIDTGTTVSGSVIVQAPTCGISDNGNLQANGNKLNVTAGSIGVSGSYVNNGGGTITPTPVTGVPAVGDPIKATPPCSGTGCTSSGPIKITAGTCSGAGCAGNVTCSGGTCTVSPGNYDDICVDNNQTVNFSAGLFIITGNTVCNTGTEFQVNAGATICNSTSATCAGMPGSANSGVTFYMTGSGSVNIDGNATAELTAPNTGTYEGLLFYQDPTDTATASLSGNNTTFYQGALYFPSARLIFGGNNTTTGTFNGGAMYTLIVSDWLTFQGNPTIELNSDMSGLGGNGGPLVGAITSARLVE